MWLPRDAWLLGKIATAFCRDGQFVEEIGESVLCRHHLALHILSHGFSQFHMSRFAICMMQVFGVGIFAASGAVRSAAVAI